MAEATFGKEQVIEVLKTVYDPEIPVNVFDLGLVYDIDIEDGEVNVVMTLTSPSCPAAQEIPRNVEDKIKAVLAVEKCMVHIVWSPPWNPQMISPEGKKIMGIPETQGGADDLDDDDDE